MIKLEEHKVYVESCKMDMVPYTVAKKALEEATLGELEKAISKLSLELTSLNPDIEELNDKDSTRES